MAMACTEEIDSVVNDLQQLRKSDFAEIMSFASAPTKVMDVMKALCVLLGHKPEWKEAKTVLRNNQDFIKQIETYDKDNIKPEAIQKVRAEYISAGRLNPEEMMMYSPVAEVVCRWIRAIEEYDRVAKSTKTS